MGNTVVVQRSTYSNPIHRYKWKISNSIHEYRSIAILTSVARRPPLVTVWTFCSPLSSFSTRPIKATPFSSPAFIFGYKGSCSPHIPCQNVLYRSARKTHQQYFQTDFLLSTLPALDRPVLPDSWLKTLSTSAVRLLYCNSQTPVSGDSHLAFSLYQLGIDKMCTHFPESTELRFHDLKNPITPQHLNIAISSAYVIMNLFKSSSLSFPLTTCM